MDEYLLVVATPEYLAAHPQFRAGKSLDGVAFLHDASPWVGAAEFIEWRTWMQAHQPRWLKHLDGPQFNLASLAIGAALNHQGVAIGRSAMVHDEIRSGRLVDVRQAWRRRRGTYCCRGGRRNGARGYSRNG